MTLVGNYEIYWYHNETQLSRVLFVALHWKTTAKLEQTEVYYGTNVKIMIKTLKKYETVFLHIDLSYVTILYVCKKKLKQPTLCSLIFSLTFKVVDYFFKTSKLIKLSTDNGLEHGY